MRVCIPSFYKAELDHLQQMYATAWKITQDLSKFGSSNIVRNFHSSYIHMEITGEERVMCY